MGLGAMFKFTPSLTSDLLGEATGERVDLSATFKLNAPLASDLLNGAERGADLNVAPKPTLSPFT